jgi:hypothetical protein
LLITVLVQRVLADDTVPIQLMKLTEGRKADDSRRQVCCENAVLIAGITGKLP